MGKLNILFMGQKPIGEDCFNYLLEKHLSGELTVAGVVTNINVDSVWWHSRLIYELAEKLKIKCIDNSQKNEELIEDLILGNDVDCIISVGHNWILSEKIINLVDGNAFNLHLAKISDYRGYYAYNHAILNNESTYGVTLHWMSSKVDEGDYVYMPSFEIKENDTAYSLYEKSLELGKDCFDKFINTILSDDIVPRNRIDTTKGKFYGRKSLEGLREIKNCNNMEDISRISRAFYFPPFDNAWFLYKNQKYVVVPVK